MQDAAMLFLSLVTGINAQASEEAGILSGQEEVKADTHRKQWLFVGSRENSSDTV